MNAHCRKLTSSWELVEIQQYCTCQSSLFDFLNFSRSSNPVKPSRFLTLKLQPKSARVMQVCRLVRGIVQKEFNNQVEPKVEPQGHQRLWKTPQWQDAMELRPLCDKHSIIPEECHQARNHLPALPKGVVRKFRIRASCGWDESKWRITLGSRFSAAWCKTLYPLWQILRK